VPRRVVDKLIAAGGAHAGLLKTCSRASGELKIHVEKDQLILRLPPRDSHYEFTHWDGDTFTYYFASENTGIARRGVKFLDGGKQVLVENLAIVNSGVFQKIN
jgi:hypothetical protein